MISEFQNEYRWLSNFWIAPIEIGGKRYRSVEHYFQACKADNEPTHEIIRSQRTPGDAKKMAKTIMIRQGWSGLRLSVMEKGVRAKFEQHLELKRKLIETYPQELQEGNYWGDSFWGIDSKTGIGENNLGKILMKLREEYFNE
jgi:hypothetical protein